MISKRIAERSDGKSSAASALRYGQGYGRNGGVDKEQGKSHRTRFGNFGLIQSDVYTARDPADIAALIELAAMEMQANCDLNAKTGADKKIAHFVISYNQERPGEAVLRDTEDSMLCAMQMDGNHFATFLHNDNGYWHMHIFASRINKDWPHRGNSLWHDQINRDKVCREIEIRHGLARDHGLHQISVEGQIVEIPRAERRSRRESKGPAVSDKVRTMEIHSGEKSFQSWCLDVRIGDRLKHARSWRDMHAVAATYQCEIKQKGAGYVICPVGEKGGIQLSKVGLKNLAQKLGPFQIAPAGLCIVPEFTFQPSPSMSNANGHYGQWRHEKSAFRRTRDELKQQQRAEIVAIKNTSNRSDRHALIAVARMRHAVTMTDLLSRNPGSTFRAYLIEEANKGDEAALRLARRYGVMEATLVLRSREADQLKVRAAIAGLENVIVPRLPFAYHVEPTGTIVFNLGHGKWITDSAIANQVQLNGVAANSSEAIGTALGYATAKFGKTLTLTGSAEFQRLAVETSVNQGLHIYFANPALQAYRQELIALNQQKSRVVRTPFDLSPQHQRNTTQGVNHVITTKFAIATRNDQAEIADQLPGINENAGELAARRGDSVHELPNGGLDVERKNSVVSLQNVGQSGVGALEAGKDHRVRHPGADKGRGRTKNGPRTRLAKYESNQPSAIQSKLAADNSDKGL